VAVFDRTWCSGKDVVFQAIADAKEEGHYISFALNSALSDMAEIIQDPRWEELAPNIVKKVAEEHRTSHHLSSLLPPLAHHPWSPILGRSW
jgi:hypothetical protein